MSKKISSYASWWTVGLICLAAASLMFWAARGDSAIDDERVHVPAGYSYVSELDYRLNPEHPPLVKALSALPVLVLEHPNFPSQSAAWLNGVNSEWTFGTDFLYRSGNDANGIIDTARIFPVVLTLLLIIYTWLFARWLMGDWWALLPAALVGFSPTFLAQGHYVTTDVAAAFGAVFATYYFLKYLTVPSKKNLWLAGLSFGAAQLMKFSMPFLIVIYILVAAILWFRDAILNWTVTARRSRTFARSALRYAWRLAVIFAIGYAIVVYPVYFLFTIHYPIQKQVSDTASILGGFAGGPTQAGAHCHIKRCIADLDIWMSGNPVLRPLAEYLLGILMVLQRISGGNTIYFLGYFANNGGWLYFPLLFLLKEPIPTLAIVLAAFAIAVRQALRPDPPERSDRTRFRRILDYVGSNTPEVAMALFVLLYWDYGVHSKLNIGFRYMLPTLPFIYILSAGVWKKWVTHIAAPAGGSDAFALSFAKYILLVALVAWLALETLFAAPYFLSYFNEFAGGTWNGYHVADDSNYDWGQDLLRLKAWADAHPDAGKIAVDYFGGGESSYYMPDRAVAWSASKGDPAAQGIHWLAVSVNTLEISLATPAPGMTPQSASDTYAWLAAIRPPATSTSIIGDLIGDPTMGDLPPPDARAGTSIFIYHL